MAALLIGVLGAILAPLVAAVRLPYTVATSFLLLLILDAVCSVSSTDSRRARSNSADSDQESSQRSSSRRSPPRSKSWPGR